MKSKVNRIMIAAPSSGSGKTTIVCAVLKLLLNKGLNVTSFKCGPDYIDPLFHAKVIGVKSRNLDLFFNDENTVKYLLSKNSSGSDVSVIEGVMGYYDGIGGKSLKASSYHLSSVTDSPVILVVNTRGMSTSVIAEIKGFIEYKCDSNIKGVILNNMSPMLYPEIKRIIEEELGIKVIGYVPKCSDFNLESRHLGLVAADEVKGIDEKLNAIAKVISETIDIESLLEIASTAGEIEYEDIKIKKITGAKIAVARDNAFSFYYEDNLSLLCEMGAEIIEFSPLKDKCLPSDINGLIIGGGYPEIYAKSLSENKSMLSDIKEKLEKGLPCLAECGGFMYLGKTIEDMDKIKHSMVGFLEMDSIKGEKLSRFGYISLVANNNNMLCKKGEVIGAHEFHYWDSTNNGKVFTANKPLRKRNWNCIQEKNNVVAGYPHIHYYSNLDFPYNFLKSCVYYKRG